ncbi:unnamed protein product, partial [Allacma fusca]
TISTLRQEMVGKSTPLAFH